VTLKIDTAIRFALHFRFDHSISGNTDFYIDKQLITINSMLYIYIQCHSDILYTKQIYPGRICLDNWNNELLLETVHLTSCYDTIIQKVILKMKAGGLRQSNKIKIYFFLSTQNSNNQIRN